MYDAMGVRRHAGLQAEVLNVVAGELLEGGHPLGERKLKEVLGHTPRLVGAGAVGGGCGPQGCGVVAPRGGSGGGVERRGVGKMCPARIR